MAVPDAARDALTIAGRSTSVPRDVGEQGHLPRALDGGRHLHLVPAAGARDPARADLALLRDERPEGRDVLEVDLLHLVAAEAAVAPPRRACGTTRRAAPRGGFVVTLLRLGHIAP